MSQSISYYDEIRKAVEADYLLLGQESKNSFSAAYNLDQSKPDFNSAALPQLWAMEIFILRNLSKNELLRRMWILREKFRLQAGDSVYSSYLASLPKEISDSALKQELNQEAFALLQEDAINITRQMQRMNHYRAQRNLAINKKKEVPIVIFLILLVGGIYVFAYTDDNSWKLILLTVHFGMIGAVVSLLQRLEQATNTPTNFTDNAINSNDIGQGMSITYMVSLVVSGAVFSVLVYLLSRSQLVNVLDLLPKPSEGEACNDCISSNIIGKLFCAPYDAGQMAKLLILCFISGFAERFVPDVLDGLIRRTRT